MSCFEEGALFFHFWCSAKGLDTVACSIFSSFTLSNLTYLYTAIVQKFLCTSLVAGPKSDKLEKAPSGYGAFNNPNLHAFC